MQEVKKEFPFEVKLGSEIIKFRKWKVKDRKNFLKILEDVDNISEKDASDVLVYNCIEGKHTFNADEFRFVLTAIRKESVSDKFDFTYTCVECDEEQTASLLLDDVVKFRPSDFKTIEIDDIKIEIGDIVNDKKYTKDMQSCTNPDDEFFTDFLYHIKSLNDSDTMGFDEIIDFLEDLDVDVMDEILAEWTAQKTELDDVYEITCENCECKEKYSFDEIPEFFPTVWFKR